MRKKASDSRKNSSPRREKRNKDDKDAFYVQDLIGIDRVIGNVIFMQDGTVCGLIEVLPINFYNKSTAEKNMILSSFESFFRGAPQSLHLKIRTEDSNVDKTIAYIRKCCANEQDPKVLSQMEDYIRNIQRLRGEMTLCQKFYVIWEYEGDIEGKKSTDTDEIYQAMMETRYTLSARLAEMGNYVVETENEVYHTCEILYNFFNPNSSITESFLDRYIRLNEDMVKFNNSVPEKYRRTYLEPDYFAPRGINLKKSHFSSFFVMDGQYHTYISLRDNGYPVSAYGGWVDILSDGKGIDVDIIVRRKNRDQVLAILSQFNRISLARANMTRNPEKQEDIMNVLSDTTYIREAMKHGDQDLFDVMTIVTIRNNSYQDMMHTRNALIKKLDKESLYVNDSFQTVRQYFDLTMPVLKLDRNIFTSIFARDKHNFLTSSLASLYCFTAYELFDDNCFVIGRNPENYTLVGLNNFNTRRYSNPHISLLGGSGAGKTFTEEMLAYRMRLSGMRTIIIAPIKARVDYLSGCRNIGGSFITLTPKSPNRLNIMAIRPAAHLSEEERKRLEEEVDSGSASMLSKKITSIQTFVQLLIGNKEKDMLTPTEETELSIELSRLYADFGINDDDRSVWKDRKRGIPKDMPIIEDLYARIQYIPELERVSTALLRCIEGDCRSLNGQTNVDLSNRYIVFDVDSKAIPEKLLPAYMYIAVDCAISMAQESVDNLDAIFFDELWKIMVNEVCAKQIFETIKVLRAYGACAVIATQDLEDLINNSNGYGAALINNTAIKMLLRMDENEIKCVENVMDLSLKDKKLLQKLHHQALIYSSGDKIICDLKASKKEEYVFCTDPELRKRMRAEIAAKRAARGR